MDRTLNLGKRQILPCIVINFVALLTSDSQFWQVRQVLWYLRQVLSNVPSDDYDDLEPLFLQGHVLWWQQHNLW